jgi:hypothetical protein
MSRIALIIQEKDATVGEIFSTRHSDTLVKLLRQYHDLESSGIESPDIAASKERIFAAMSITNEAFEQELKNIFRTDMLDVDAESAAYLHSLRIKGLINNKNNT